MVDIIKKKLETIEKASKIILQQEVNHYLQGISPVSNIVVEYLQNDLLNDLTYNQAILILEQYK